MAPKFRLESCSDVDVLKKPVWRLEACSVVPWLQCEAKERQIEQQPAVEQDAMLTVSEWDHQLFENGSFGIGLLYLGMGPPVV